MLFADLKRFHILPFENHIYIRKTNIIIINVNATFFWFKGFYGKYLIKELSERLAEEYGKGFDESNLSQMRMFYLIFPILDAVRQELSSRYIGNFNS